MMLVMVMLVDVGVLNHFMCHGGKYARLQLRHFCFCLCLATWNTCQVGALSQMMEMVVHLQIHRPQEEQGYYKLGKCFVIHILPSFENFTSGMPIHGLQLCHGLFILKNIFLNPIIIGSHGFQLFQNVLKLVLQSVLLENTFKTSCLVVSIYLFPHKVRYKLFSKYFTKCQW